MAVTRLSDLIVPEVFNQNMMVHTKELSNIWQSGILTSDPTLAGNLAGAGRIYQVPFYKDLANDAENISSDDPDVSSTPKKITTGKDQAVRHNRNQSWSSMDLNAQLTGSDPMGAIKTRVADYWQRRLQKLLVSSIKGVMADNAANDSGDMRFVIGTDGAGAITDAELISDTAIIDAKQTMGDASEMLSVIIMHSKVLSRLQKLDLIEYLQPSGINVRWPTYLGYRVVVDDGCPAVAGTNRILYSTYLVAQGAFVYAESPPPVPVEVDRKPGAGNGSGQEILYTRRQFLLHPKGIKWTDSSCAGLSPTNAELETAANWDRVYTERKMIGLVELVTNG